MRWHGSCSHSIGFGRVTEHHVDAPKNDDKTAETPTKARRAMGKTWIIAAIAAFVVAGGAAVWYWQAHSAKGDKQAREAKPLAPLQFHPIDPAFVANLRSGTRSVFLQIEVRIGSRDPDTITLLKSSDPVIRNDLLLLFGSQDPTSLETREGKEKLRADALATIRKVVAVQGGNPSAVEAVFFTSFVMQ